MNPNINKKTNVHSDPTKPLAGIRVVDLTLAGSGPSCTKLLAEFGAEVIWVESLTGASTRTVHKYDFYCTGKRDLSINLKTPEGKEALRRIIERSDVFVSNYRPKGLAHLGLTYEEVKAIRPDIIYATLTGFGESGAEANNAGYDTVAFWAKSGLLQDIAEKGTLVVPPIAVGDISTGLSLFGGIATALYRRAMTGEGCHVYTSLLAQAMYLNHDALIETQYGEEYPKSRLAPRRALLNTYQCSDGKWITVSVPANWDRYFPRLMKALDLETELNSGRWKCAEDTMYENAPEVVRMLDRAFARLTQDEALRRLTEMDIPVSPVQSTREALRDPQVLANHYVYKLPATVPPSAHHIHHSGIEDAERGEQSDPSEKYHNMIAAPHFSGDHADSDSNSTSDADSSEEIYVPASPIKFETDLCGTTATEKGPALGQDTEEILRELGFSEEEIQEFKDRKIVRA